VKAAAAGEQAVGHGAVQQGGDHPAVQQAGVSFQAGMSDEGGADTAILLRLELEAEAEGVGPAADQAVGMNGLRKGRPDTGVVVGAHLAWNPSRPDASAKGSVL